MVVRYLSKNLVIKTTTTTTQPFLRLAVWKQREKLCGVLTAIDTPVVATTTVFEIYHDLSLIM